MKIFLCCLFSILIPAFAMCQKTFKEFVIQDNKVARVEIKDSQLIVNILTEGKRQVLEEVSGNIENIEALDINDDGFPDIVLHLKWKNQHKHSHIYLYKPNTETFEKLDTQGHNLLNIAVTESGKFTSNRIKGFGYNEFAFKSLDEIYLAAEVKTFNHVEMDLEVYHIKRYDHTGDVLENYFVRGSEEIANLYEYVGVSKVDLYAQPFFGSKSKGYLIADDEFKITDYKDGEWIAIIYNSKKHGEIQAWVNIAELRIDKYSLDTSAEKSENSLNLSFLYPYDEGRFYFSLGLNNNSPSPFSAYNGRIYILLENTESRRYLYDLYETIALKLPPKSLEDTYGQDNDGRWYVPSALLDDNLVEWDDEFQQYVIYHVLNETVYYPEFISTAIPAGKYKMYVVFYDPFSGVDALLSNSQEVVLPLPKVPIKQIENNE